ncbi:MAG: histidine phosphatase family protein [Actinomycetes bacterium]
MATIYLVRHGQAQAGFHQHADPGLDEVGQAQAEAMAASLTGRGPLPIMCSPLRRTIETSAPLRENWGARAPFAIDARVAEIPSPSSDLSERGVWLSEAMAGTWTDLGADYEGWRDDLVDAVLELPTDTVVVSHFIAINAIVGCAIGDDRVMHSSFGNCSVTTITTAPSGPGSLGRRDRLTVESLGATTQTTVG